jgi:hypothetical protein
LAGHQRHLVVLAVIAVLPDEASPPAQHPDELVVVDHPSR